MRVNIHADVHMLDSTETMTAEHAAPPTSLWRAVRESVRGSHRRDYTEGDVGRAVILLAVPMVLEMLMESIFAVCDIFYVSHWVGPDAVATVGLTESMLTIIYTVAIGLSIGAMAMVARRIGERDPEEAARTAWQVIVLGLFISLALGGAGILLAPRLLALMGASPGVLANVNYTRVMLGGCASVVLLFLINAIFRGAGDAAVAMRVLWLANTINILLGPCLILGLGPFPKLGVTGAAVATTIGRATGALFAFSRLWRAGGHIKLARRHLKISPAVMARLVRLSSTGTLQIFIGTASWIGLIRLISTFGSDALAGYTIGIRVILFALFPSWGMSNAAATMVGQALGARKPERAERAVWRAGLYNVCFLGAVGLVFVVCAGPIARLFTHDPAVLRYATDCLRIVACGFLFYAYGMVLTQSFNGAGDTWTPTYLNLFIFWLWEIPLAYVLAKVMGLGPRGVFLAITVAFSTLAVVSALLFRRGKWKAKVV